MNGYLRIGGALAMGTVLVLGAFLVGGGETSPQVASAIVSVAPDRTYIEASDADSNGVEDWRETFPLPTATIELPEEKVAGVSDTRPYEEPTTFTGKFAKAFFTDIVRTKSVTGSMPSTDDGFIQGALDSVVGSTRSRMYSRLDVNDVPTTPESLHAYGNTVALIFSQDIGVSENQLLILERAVKTQNPAELAPLESYVNFYSDIRGELLKVSVPDILADDHAKLVSTVEAIHADLKAMQIVFEDPLYALSRVKQHTDNIEGFFGIVKRITTTLLANGVSYEKDEPGAIIYTINI